MKRLFQHDTSAKLLLFVSVGLGFAGGVLIIVQAVYLARITDRAFLSGLGLTELKPLMMLLLGWIGLRVVVYAAGEMVSAQMAVLIKGELRKRLIGHLKELGPSYAKGERSGELIGTVYEGIEHLEIYLAKYVPQIALSAMLPIAVFSLVASLDWVTAIILAGTFPLLILFMILIGKSTKVKTERQWRSLGLLSGHFMDVLRGISTLKIFNRSKAQLTVIARVSDQYRKTTMETLRIAFMSAFVMELFTTLSTAVIAVFLGLRLISGDIDFERAFLVLLLAPEFYLPVRVLGTQFHAGANGVAAAKRIFDILDTKPLGWTEREDGERLEMKEKGYRIEFEGVGFAYPDCLTPVVSDLSFTIESGERVAILGPTGSGKSTILDLLLGFLRPTEGRILIDGVDMSRLSIAWWREQLAPVAQRMHLFHDTIAGNIRLANPAASMKEVIYAAEQAQADAFIQALPDGYLTPVTESVRLSGGQMSRLAMARAFLKKTPMLLLDEPTAQLDIKSENAVQQALESLLKNRTAVLVAHRLGMVRLADKIVMMQEGRIVEYGKPSELLACQGLYAQMVLTYESHTHE